MPSPSEYNLSEGSLQIIMSGGDVPNPIMQVLGSKVINAGCGDKEKIRMLLSDGKYTISFAMAPAQLSPQLGPTYSVVQLDKYITSVINNSGKGDARVLLILGIHTIVSGDEISGKIGSPIPLNEAESAKNGTTSTPSASKNVQSNNNVKPSYTPNVNVSNVSAMDTSTSLANCVPHPIISLSPYHNKWVVKARVTNKSPIRTWSNSKGEGKLFSFDLVDESGEIRVTAFRDAVDKFYDYLQVDKIYYINKCQIKGANKQFSTLKNDYELTVTNETTIQECHDADDSAIPQTQYNFLTIDKIAELEVNTLVDVVGVVKSVGDLQTFQAKTTGRELKKKEVVLVDQSETAIALTLWGAEAENFDGANNPVVVLKGAKIGEFGGGKTLSTIGSSNLKINPEIKECYRIRGWYDSVGENLNAKNISARAGVGNFSANWLTFNAVKEQRLGTSERGDYYQLVGTILLLKSENIVYKACPTQECNKKIVDLENGMYRCEKCNREYPNFKYRLMASLNVGDHTDNQWLSMFNSEVEKILGMTAEEVGQQIEQNTEEIKNIVDKAHFRRFLFKCRAKMETYNDEERLKTVCIKVDPVNNEEYNSHLVEKIQEMIC